MAFVVHDLKNPVNSMDLQAQVLLRDRTLSEPARAAATQIRSEAQQLGRMIVNLLDLSKADEGKLAPRIARVDLRALVEGVLGELRVSAQARNVELRSTIATPYVNADEDLLRRTFANLVENAIRHSPQGGVVAVDVAPDADGMKLRVTDAGVGVPVEMRERIFDPFLQIESGDRSVNRSGRGLGLTFCRLAVEAHGGRIWVEEGAPGAVFCVRLPESADARTPSR
jgi:signal transduction histidine kinase